MSMPFSSSRPRVGSWNRATRSVTVVLPAPLRPTSATTVPPATFRLKSRTTGRPSRYSKSTASNSNVVTTGGADRASGLSGLSPSIASTSKTRSIAARERCSSEKELTMFQTGLSSRNVYHWNAMMSPIEARPVTFRNPPYQTMTTLTTLTSRPQHIHSTSSRRCAKRSLRRTVCRPSMYSSSSRVSRPNARTTRMPEKVSPTRPSISSTSLRVTR